MRPLCLVLALLLPVVSTAQVAASVHEAPEAVDLDRAPAMVNEPLVYALLTLGVAAFVGATVSIGAGDSCGKAAVTGLTWAAGAAVCAVVLSTGCNGMETGAEIPTAHSASGVAYPADALVAFHDGTLSTDQRQLLAEAAREAGYGGVVLRHVREVDTGVSVREGSASGLVLDVAVLDAATARFRPLGDDPLLPSTTRSVPLGTANLDAATSRALASVSH